MPTVSPLTLFFNHNLATLLRRWDATIVDAGMNFGETAVWIIRTDLEWLSPQDTVDFLTWYEKEVHDATDTK